MNLRQKATEMAIREGIKMLQKDFDANAVKLIEPAKKKFADNALYI